MNKTEAPERIFISKNNLIYQIKWEESDIEYILKSKADSEKEELKKYVRHTEDCDPFYRVNNHEGWVKKGKCTCGLDKLLNE